MMLVVANLRLGGIFRADRGMDHRAAATASPASDRHLHQRAALGVPGQRHRVPGHDPVRAAHGAAAEAAAGAVLLAVATASNIGSAATITGNPQNMLIGSVSGISYLEFIVHLGPVAVGGLFLNWALLHRHLPAQARSTASASQTLCPHRSFSTSPCGRNRSSCWRSCWRAFWLVSRRR